MKPGSPPAAGAPDPRGHALAGALLLCAVSWFALGDDEPTLTSVDCSAAVELDGLLRCGDEAPQTIDELCGDDDSSAPIRPGDSIRAGRVCVEATRGGAGWGRMDPDDLRALELPTQVNEASVEELDSLPGIGPVLAGRVIEARPFSDIDSLIDVKGIGPKKLAALRGRARVRW